MCFRPSAVAGQVGNQIQMGECPHCKQPVAASIGISGGECPHCHKTIQPEAKDAGGGGIFEPGKNTKIF